MTMKKFYLILLAGLTFASANAVDKQTYAEIPDNFPDAFSWSMTRNDYRGTDENGDPVLVSTDLVDVMWSPDYVNASACYGKLTIYDFYSNDCLENSATLEFTNEKNRNFQVSEDGKTITFSFTGYYFSKAKTEAPYSSAYGKTSQFALLAQARKGTDNRTSRYWMDGEYLSYAYNGGSALNCVLDLEEKTITIDHAWGAFMTKDEYGASPSYVIEYFDKSVFEDHSSSTAITEVKSEPASVNDGYYYSISGQRVLNPTPGFYIHNGKKVIVK